LDGLSRWHIEIVSTCSLSRDGLLCVERAIGELAEALQFAVDDTEAGTELA
jgi:hypothetical protein